MLFSGFFWGLHFFFLGAYAGVAMVIVWAIRLLLSIRYNKNKYVFFFVIWIVLLAGAMTYQNIFSLIPIITSLMGAYGFFYLSKIRLRILMLASSMLWFIYSLSIGSISWVTNDVLTQLILITTIYRMAHPMWGTQFYAQKIRDILLKRPKIDYDRYIFVQDKILYYRHRLWHYFLQILHLDLQKSILQKSWKLCDRYLHSKREAQHSDAILSRLHLKK